MTSNRRFFSDHAVIQRSHHTLSGSEHQHLAKVLRAQPGDSVTLFDGTGFEYGATIESVRRNQTELLVGEKRTVDRELPFELTLAVALPKGDRQQWLVEKAVELGVTQLVPLKTEFGVAQAGEKARERISRWIIAASKQCGRNHLMQLAAATTPTELFTVQEHLPTLIAHPNDASDIRRELAKLANSAAMRIVVGPEGGFSDKEIELAIANECKIVSLGPRILRIETATVALISAFIYAWHP